MAELPSPKYGIGVAAVGERVYICGGSDGRECFDDVVVFDAATGELETVAHLEIDPKSGKVVRIAHDPATGVSEDVKFKSFLFW